MPVTPAGNRNPPENHLLLVPPHVWDHMARNRAITGISTIAAYAILDYSDYQNSLRSSFAIGTACGIAFSALDNTLNSKEKLISIFGLVISCIPLMNMGNPP